MKITIYFLQVFLNDLVFVDGIGESVQSSLYFLLYRYFAEGLHDLHKYISYSIFPLKQNYVC